jgi:predicted transcriptional regulator
MAKPRRYRLGDLQLKIMKVLWEQGPTGVAEVRKSLEPDAELAYTTIATMLRKMESRGLVVHGHDGRRFMYEATVAPEAVTRSMADDMLERLFDGSLAGLMHHLLTTREVSRDELRQLEHLIAERKKQV